MKSRYISFPLIHKKSSLPIFAVFLGVIGTIPSLMVLWVAICSQFTRIEDTNETAFYNVYVWVRAIFAIILIICLAFYEGKRSSTALIPAGIAGLVSSVMRLCIHISNYTEKKAFAESMSMQASYTQNYLDISEAATLLIIAVLMLLYLFGVLRTAFPLVFASVISTIIMIYSIISYSTTYGVSAYSVLCRCYAIPFAIGVLLFSLSTKTKRQLERKEKYKARRYAK